MISGLAIRIIEAQEDLPAAPLCRVCSVPLIGQKMIQAGEEEGTESAPVTLRPVQPVPGQQAGKEFLGQILGIFARVAAPPGVGMVDSRDPWGYSTPMTTKNPEKTSEKTRQAIIWGRFSSAQQEEGDSRDRQDRLNRQLAKREGIEVIAEYFDEGVSVKEGVTPKFKAVLAKLPKGVGIICEDLDRINRAHPIDQLAYIKSIIEKGHFIVTSSDGHCYDSETINQVATLAVGSIKATVGYGENQKRINRVREEKGKAIELARQGKPAPLGAWLPSHLKYNFETHQYDFARDASGKLIKEIVERIFTEYTQGKGTSSIAKGLNRDGVLTFGSKIANGWTRSSISEMLRYEGLIGVLNIKGERIPNAFPPAIPEKLFFKVQGMLESNVNRGGNITGDKVNNVFRGILKCPHCGKSVKVYKGRNLGCSGYRDGQCTVKTMIPYKALETAMVHWLVFDVAKDIIGKDESAEQLSSLKQKHENLSKFIEERVALFMDPEKANTLPLAAIEKQLTKLEAEKKAIEAAMSGIQVKETRNASQVFEQMKLFLNLGDMENRKQLSAMVPQVVKAITVDLEDRHNVKLEMHSHDGKQFHWTHMPKPFTGKASKVAMTWQH